MDRFWMDSTSHVFVGVACVVQASGRDISLIASAAKFVAVTGEI